MGEQLLPILVWSTLQEGYVPMVDHFLSLHRLSLKGMFFLEIFKISLIKVNFPYYGTNFVLVKPFSTHFSKTLICVALRNRKKKLSKLG